MQVEVLSVKGLSFAYNGKEVLDQISFDLAAGEFVGLVGPNGSGKSTLIKNLLGILVPQSGTITLFGTEIRHFHEWHRIGYLPQKLNLSTQFFPATVSEIVALGLIARGKREKSRSSEDKAITRALDLLDILPIKEKLIGELSGGQQQRVLLARALVGNPEMLILDEPTSAIDPETRERFFAVIRGLNTEQNLTIILITHDIGNIGRYAKKLLYLDRKIVFYGGFDDFCTSPDMSEFFGPASQHIICHRHDTP
jgi:zinc transport system ATP-binding protein